MNTFVADVLSFARPIFIDAVSSFADITPLIESVGNEVRLTMSGRQRNERDVGVRIYQLETITRMITTLDPLERADTTKRLLPALRYATTPEWLTMRAEATDFEYGPEQFEIVLATFLNQMLGASTDAEDVLDIEALRSAIPEADVHHGHLRIDTSKVVVELLPISGWVRARAPIADVEVTEAQRLRMNDHITFFRVCQDGKRLFVEGEYPNSITDVHGMRWLVEQIAATAVSVGKSLSLVASV